MNPACLTPSGPGQVYFLDSTVAHIGGEARGLRADVCLLLDLWIPHIPGFSLEYGQDHDHDAALNSLLMDREELCRDYRLPYRSTEWAYTGLPFIIVADPSLEIASAIGIEVVALPRYRGAMKSPLESALAACAEALATATPETAMSVFILEIIRWNQQPLKPSALPSEARVQQIYPSPVAIANWGMQRITGAPIINCEKAGSIFPQREPKRRFSHQKGN